MDTLKKILISAFLLVGMVVFVFYSLDVIYCTKNVNSWFFGLYSAIGTSIALFLNIDIQNNDKEGLSLRFENFGNSIIPIKNYKISFYIGLIYGLTYLAISLIIIFIKCDNPIKETVIAAFIGMITATIVKYAYPSNQIKPDE